jgi:uncharacterized protein
MDRATTGEAGSVELEAKPKRKGGFAALSPEQRSEISRRGGKAAHVLGTAHKFTPEEARAAGRKGGSAVAKNRAHMAEIGRVGGSAKKSAASPEPVRE